ncbi:hypothetical protein C8R43DRAFT_1235939 [Mycena crocata]|nr:hypothetical protein C8R43DRAFT_1235939 [Mycena crocata]
MPSARPTDSKSRVFYGLQQCLRSSNVPKRMEFNLIDLCLHLRRLSSPSSPLPPLIAIVAATAIGVSASPRRRRRCLLSPSHLPLIAVAATFCSSLPPVAAIAANTTATSQALHRVPVWLLFKKDIKSPPYAACDIFFRVFAARLVASPSTDLRLSLSPSLPLLCTVVAAVAAGPMFSLLG